MAITRVENGKLWEERADTPEDARALFERHGKDLQKHGAESFHKSFLEDQAIGFERLRRPDGKVETVRADRVGERLGKGYSGSGVPRMRMPEVPWVRKRVAPGRHRYKVVNGQIVEVS